ncbi:MAG: hypothetical protein Q4A42_03690 [Tissierellia bacterium]|nr:hypothetical protein [Tissierellia bacterium]
MIYLILGPSGSGKTKHLIEEANSEKAKGNGNIVFIDTDDSHIFTLDYAVRLINAAKYGIKDSKMLYGFLAGIASRDYDIEKMYLDGIYDIINFNEDTFVELIDNLNKLSDEFNVDIYFGLDKCQHELPKGIKAEMKVLC